MDSPSVGGKREKWGYPTPRQAQRPGPAFPALGGVFAPGAMLLLLILFNNLDSSLRVITGLRTVDRIAHLA